MRPKRSGLSPLCQILLPSFIPTSYLLSLRGAIGCRDPTLSAARPQSRETRLPFAVATPMIGIHTGNAPLCRAAEPHFGEMVIYAPESPQPAYCKPKLSSVDPRLKK